ncbi:MAG: hypothetical protein ACE5D6_00810, partial [Candidatus Zixiibacteriota bacterium]
MKDFYMFRLSFFVTVLFFLILTTILYASENKYQLGVQGGVTTLSGGESPKYTFQRSVGFDFGYWFKERWSLNFNLSRHKNFNDTSATSSLSFGADELNATRKWQATRLGLTVNHLLFEADNQWNLSLAWGGGLMIWKILDPIGDTVINVSGIHNETVDYATSEIFFTGISSIHMSLNQKWSVDWSFQADYLTGAGAEFASSVKSLRDKWQLGSFISLNLHFGKVGSKIKWKSENTWSPQTSRQNFKSLDPNDNDGDGITDDNDKCQNTPVGVKVDKYGCSFDTDGDGVSDAHDDCPGTDRLAVGMIDVNGCPVDSD